MRRANGRICGPHLLKSTREFRAKVAEDLEQGRDHLLELSSFNREQGEELAEVIGALDQSTALEEFMIEILDHFGVTIEDMGGRGYVLKPEHLFSAEAFQGIPAEGLSITFGRVTALAREELTFMSWDHPMVASSIDMLLASGRGNACFVQVPSEAEGLLLDAIYVLEPVAPPRLHADRYLPPSPIRAIADHGGEERTQEFKTGALRGADVGDAAWLRERGAALKELVPRMIRRTRRFVEDTAEQVRQHALAEMEEQSAAEIDRLERLRTLGHPVREEELMLAKEERDQLAEAIGAARLRLDSIRLVRLTPEA